MIDETKEQGSPEEQPENPVLEDPDILEPVVEETEESREEELETLRKELAESRDQLLRVMAEFDNFKKRMERDKGKLIRYAGENILRDLLTTVDNLDRAMVQGEAASGDAQQKLAAMLEGIALTRKGLVSMLERHEVAPLQAMGMLFNPDEHDALTMEASDEMPVNHVIREFARGYRFKDRVLRHAQVIVSRGPARNAE